MKLKKLSIKHNIVENKKQGKSQKHRRKVMIQIRSKINETESQRNRENETN